MKEKINILIPLAGKSQFFSEIEYPFPKPLIEFCGKTMIAHVLKSYDSISDWSQFIFVVNRKDCVKYHLDDVLTILTDSKCKIIYLEDETRGAACSALMAVEYIDNDIQLIISNADQLIHANFLEIFSCFENSDAGVLIFDSVHPRWSYVKLNGDCEVIEAAEKRPISKNAIAGFYYFNKGKDFISAAKNMIKKDANINGEFYISPVLNELILLNKKVCAYKINNSDFHTFYTPWKIREYEILEQKNHIEVFSGCAAEYETQTT